MPSRLLKDLDKEVQTKFLAFSALMAQEGIPFILTCTYRSQEEQDTLYAQGRLAAGKIVTWTKHSRHSETRNGEPASKAFDIAIIKDGKPTWDLKVSVNDDNIPDYIQAAEIGRKVGLRAGADFKDYPHFESIYK